MVKLPIICHNYQLINQVTHKKYKKEFNKILTKALMFWHLIRFKIINLS